MRYEINLRPTATEVEETAVLDTVCTLEDLILYESEGWLTKGFYDNILTGVLDPDRFDFSALRVLPYLCYRNANKEDYMDCEHFMSRVLFSVEMLSELYYQIVNGNAELSGFKQSFKVIDGSKSKKK